MNVLLTLLIYNPIEAYTLVLLCDAISGSNTIFSIKTVFYLYAFGVSNFVIQIIPYIWIGTDLHLIANIVSAYMVAPFALWLFYSNVIGKKLTIRQSFVAMFIHCIFIIVISFIYGVVFNTYTQPYNDDNLHEFIVNFIIFFVQISIYRFIIKKRVYYEELCKGNFRKGGS